MTSPEQPDVTIARRELIQKVSGRVAEHMQRGDVSMLTGKLGNLAVLEGSVKDKTGYMETIVTIVERTISTGEQVATILTRGRFISRNDIPLTDSGPDNTTLSDQNKYLALRDQYLYNLVSGADFNLASSANAAMDIAARPRVYGLQNEIE